MIHRDFDDSYQLTYLFIQINCRVCSFFIILIPFISILLKLVLWAFEVIDCEFHYKFPKCKMADRNRNYFFHANWYYTVILDLIVLKKDLIFVLSNQEIVHDVFFKSIKYLARHVEFAILDLQFLKTRGDRAPLKGINKWFRLHCIYN